MQSGIWIVFAVAMALLTMQSIGGYFQIKNYQTTIKTLRPKGNIGIGKKRGGFLSGHIAIVACDSAGKITALKALDGISLVARFRDIHTLLELKCIGSSIYDFLAIFQAMPKKQKKRYTGYIMALQALEMRLGNLSQTHQN